MPPAALAMLLVAAVLHTGWNLLLKRAAADAWLSSWLALLMVGLLGAPIWLAAPPAPAIWGLLLWSAVAEAAYFSLLAAAYRRADFSLVYPIARGAAPALLALWGALFLAERPSPAGLLGLGLIVVGLGVVGWRRGALRHAADIGLALSVALCVSIYSAIDAAAVRQTPALSYTLAVFALSALLITPAALWRYGPAGLWAGARATVPRAALIGALMFSAYLLALLAYRIAPVGYAGAVREIGVLLAALAGWRLFGEPLGRRRLLGAGVIFAGILAIAFWG